MNLSLTCLIAATDCSRFEVSSIDDEYDCDDVDGNVTNALSIEDDARGGLELIETTSDRGRLLPTGYIYYCFSSDKSLDYLVLGLEE